jgi:hypothetical protein
MNINNIKKSHASLFVKVVGTMSFFFLKKRHESMPNALLVKRGVLKRKEKTNASIVFNLRLFCKFATLVIFFLT